MSSFRVNPTRRCRRRTSLAGSSGGIGPEIPCCPKCQATALVSIEVGLRCLTCGKIVYTADADFLAELYRSYRSVCPA